MSTTGGGPRLEIAWLGHATVDIAMGDVRVLTDPVLRDRVGHLRRHHGTARLDPGPLDAVLVSHLHHDHLDLPSLRRLPSTTVVIVPTGAGRLAGRAVAGEVVEMVPGQEVAVGSVRITAVPAAHAWGRALRRVRGQPLGFVLQDAGSTVYFPGDTDLHPAMADLPAPDVALLPIWGWGPTLGAGHLDPQRAAQAATLLRAGAVLPVHWGTFAPIGARRRGSPAWLDRPARDFAEAMARDAPHVHLQIVRPGSDRTTFGPAALSARRRRGSPPPPRSRPGRHGG